MAILKPTRVSSDLFRYQGRERQFVTQISDLGPNFTFGRVYDDAMDVGLTLISARTGDELVFAMVEEQKDAEGDLVAWRLVPADRKKRKLCDMIIFND